MAPLYLLAVLLVSLGPLALRRRPRLARAVYRIALLLAALPYVVHVQHTWGWVSGFGDPQPRIGVYPGLVAFAVAGLLGTVALVAAALALARRMPLASAALPPALWLFYWLGALRLIYWRAPAFVPIDNKPLIGLFVFSAVATVLLGVAAWFALARPASVPAPVRRSSHPGLPE